MQQIITVSRQFGSGGKSVAEKIASLLGVPFYDKEIIAEAAKNSGIAAEHFERADEKRNNSFLFSLVSSHYGMAAPLEMNNLITDDNLFLCISDAVKKLAVSPCVILGRCADDILRDLRPFRIFVCAEADDRISKVAQNRDMSEKAAAALVRKMDKSRANYYNFYTGKTWGDASNYDLCVNTSLLTPDGAAQLIAGALAKNNN